MSGIGEADPVGQGRQDVRRSGERSIERLLIVMPQDGADGAAAGSELENYRG